MPEVSVIIPAHNAGHCIRETIESVQKQTLRGIEIILIDDGSTDSTAELFPEFSANGVICLSQLQSGASAARNLGLEFATGDYIQFLDADDLLHPEKLELQQRHMLEQDVQLSFTLWSSFTRSPPSEYKPSYTHDYGVSRSGAELLVSFGHDGWFIPIHSWLTQKELIEKAGHWNPLLTTNDDGEFFSRVLMHCERVVCLDQNFAYYRRENANSLSRLTTSKKLQSAYDSWRLIHALVACRPGKEPLVYPQRAFYILFWETIETNKTWAKTFARQFDRLNSVIRYPHIRKFALFSRLVDWLGLYRGVWLYRIFKRLRELLYNLLNRAKFS
jgi:glycosyltransferase involved in cell wall biosynthesis